MPLTDGQRRVLAFLANYGMDLPEAILKAGYSAKRLRQTVYQFKKNPHFMRAWSEKKDGASKAETAPLESKDTPRKPLTDAEKIEKMRQLAELCEAEGKYNDAEKYWRQYFVLTGSFDDKQDRFAYMTEKELEQSLNELKRELLGPGQYNVLEQSKALMGPVKESPKVEDEPAPKPWQAGSSSFELPEAPTPKLFINAETTHCDLHGPFRSKTKFDQCPQCKCEWDRQNEIEAKRISNLTMPADFRGR